MTRLRARGVAPMLAVVALLAGACTIEQDLTPVVAGDGTPDPTEDPSPGSEQPTDDPTGDPGDDASPSPSEDPTDDPTTDPTQDPSDGASPSPSERPTTDPSPEPSNDPTEDVSPDPSNRAPAAVDDTARTDEDTRVAIDVLANDTDPDGDALSVRSVSGGTRGTPAISGSQVVYTPDANVNGTDTFTYVVEDPGGASDTGTVTVTITPVNDPPNARGDNATTREDTPVTIDVLANDTDPEGDPLTVASVTQPSRGRAILQGDQITYEPDANYRGSDSFTYTIDDGNGGTDTATVVVTVTSVNDAPTAQGDGPFLVQANGSVVLSNLLANDSDPDGDDLTIEIVSQPAHGSARLVDDTTVEYVNNDSAYGDDSFTYRAHDGAAGSSPVTVTLDVNRSPFALNDSMSIQGGSTQRDVFFNVISGTQGSGWTASDSFSGGPDTDADGDSLTYTGPANPVAPSGVAVQCAQSGDCQVRVLANTNCVPNFSWTYTVQDGRGGTDTATVSVIVDDPCIT